MPYPCKFNIGLLTKAGDTPESKIYNTTLKNLRAFFTNNEIGKQTDGCHIYYGKTGYSQANSTREVIFIVGMKNFFPKVVGYIEYWQENYKDYTKVNNINDNLPSAKPKFFQNEYYGYISKQRVMSMKPQ